MKLPLRERVLNAYAGGFAPRWIAERFGVSLNTVRWVLYEARKVSDKRAAPVARSIVRGRQNAAIRQRDLRVSPSAHLELPDEFRDLPGVYDPILPFGGRIPQSVEDLEWR